MLFYKDLPQDEQKKLVNLSNKCLDCFLKFKDSFSGTGGIDDIKKASRMLREIKKNYFRLGESLDDLSFAVNNIIDEEKSRKKEKYERKVKG